MPIIQSLLDVDFYKFTMGQLVFKRYRDVPVRYAFRNRTARVKLGHVIDEQELREELDLVRELALDNSELHYLRGTNEYGERMFAEEYLEFLSDLRLPPYELEVVDGDLRLQFAGRWAEAIYWETLALAIVNELYYRTLCDRLSPFGADVVLARGRLRLEEKIQALRERPEVTFIDFGARRRFSREWQLYVDEVLAEELPQQFLGSSNTESALLNGLLPMGTSAHELFMVMAGLMGESDHSLRASSRRVLEDWWEQYGWGLSIALTDTWGSDFFFRDMTREQARQWKGLRHDSGDPFAFGEQVLAFYQNHGIDASEKLLIFSDGLELDRILRLHERFASRIKVSFGWGTNLTNDLGFEPLSLVVKVVEAAGRPTVKLSDNLAKATGSPEDIEHYKRVFGHTVTTWEACRY